MDTDGGKNFVVSGRDQAGLEADANLNVKGYYEFAASNRPDGWNAWLTLVIPLSPAKK